MYQAVSNLHLLGTKSRKRVEYLIPDQFPIETSSITYVPHHHAKTVALKIPIANAILRQPSRPTWKRSFLIGIGLIFRYWERAISLRDNNINKFLMHCWRRHNDTCARELFMFSVFWLWKVVAMNCFVMSAYHWLLHCLLLLLFMELKAVIFVSFNWLLQIKCCCTF